MRNEAKYFPNCAKDEYVNEGPKLPIAGPIFPRLAAETPNAPKDKFNPPVKLTTITARPIIISNATPLDNA